MNQEEFKALGITEKDLVCIIYEGEMAVHKLVGSILFAGEYDIHLGISPEIFKSRSISITWHEIFEIEILQKEFWKCKT